MVQFDEGLESAFWCFEGLFDHVQLTTIMRWQQQLHRQQIISSGSVSDALLRTALLIAKGGSESSPSLAVLTYAPKSWNVLELFQSSGMCKHRCLQRLLKRYSLSFPAVRVHFHQKASYKAYACTGIVEKHPGQIVCIVSWKSLVFMANHL